MTEETGAAEAAAEPVAVEPQAAPAPEPKAEPKVEPRPDSAVRRAFAKMEAAEKGEEAKPAEKPEAEKAPEPGKASEVKPDEGQPRGEDGKFKAKDEGQEKPEAGQQKPEQAEKQPEQPKDAAPSRFSPDAKAEWEKAPPAIRAEVNRAITELESGIQRYQAEFAPIKPFADMARQQGTTLDQALKNYVGIEQMLARDPVQGFNVLAQNLGIDFKALAQHVLGQQGDQPQPDQHIARLESQVQQLNQQLLGMMQEQRVSGLSAQVNDFAAKNEHFDALASDMATLITNGEAADLQDAYDKALARAQELAARFTPQQPAAPAAPPPAQTRKPPLSISGAPGPGSNPATRLPPSSAREAVRRALTAG